jgi:hypothetical protein
MVDWKDGLLGLKYEEYQNIPGFVLPPGVESPLDLVDAQASIFFRVIRTFFRFRQLPDPVHFLKDAETYEGIRAYMREGAQVAFTWNGPVAFSPIGQNTGRLPPTFQFTADEKLGLVFPMERATTQVVFPSPATMPCPTPASDLRIANKSKCALCAPFCQTRCMSGQFVVHEVQVEGNRTSETSCAECRSGLYSTGSADEGQVLATQCTLCVSGTFSKQGSSACTACPVGYFQPEDGQLGCLSCDGLGDAY